jgi:hypothetical protein
MSLLTKREKRRLARMGVVVVIAGNPRYKRVEIRFERPEQEPVLDWVCWKMARKGGKLARIEVEERNPTSFYVLRHRNTENRGWHDEGQTGTLDELVAYVVRRDLLQG